MKCLIWPKHTQSFFGGSEYPDFGKGMNIYRNICRIKWGWPMHIHFSCKGTEKCYQGEGCMPIIVLKYMKSFSD